MGGYPKGDPRSNGHRWRQSVARLRSEGRGCWICRAFGRPDYIDYSLPALDPMSFEADHLVPLSKGGDPWSLDNLDAAHRACNNWRKNRSVAEVIAIARRSRANRQVVPSTDW
jgi:5-methylcytosine-specific restriction endonuclease McrA